MTMRQAGSSQAAWALLTEGVTAARVEAHRLRAMVARVMRLVEASPAKEHLYQVAGDIIVSAPGRLEVLERHLDRTSYALSVFGSDTLREMLPMHDRTFVDDAAERSAPMFGPRLHRSTARVAERYLARRADLSPPLGYPGGPCHVIDRVEESIRDPRLQEQIVDQVEHGRSLTNPEAAKVYAERTEPGVPGTKIRRIILTAHAQYRMDLRQIPLPAIRAALGDFFKAYMDLKSQRAPVVQRWEEAFARGQPVEWAHRKMNLFVVFLFNGQDATVVTTYWQGDSDPHPPGDGGCDG